MLHAQFGDQYDALAEAIDEIAERIRALGHQAPGSFAQFKKLSAVEEQTGAPKAASTASSRRGFSGW
jgi:starvation-inducible DNA-binding protein